MTAGNISQEHQALMEALALAQEAVHALRQRDGAWQALAAARLKAAAGSLELHCSSSEAPDGLLADVQREAGHSRNVTSAHRDHEELCGQVGELQALAAEGMDPERALAQALELVTLLRQHLNLEGDLVYEAAMGGEQGALD
jgi:hypothetical protein